MNEDRLLRKIGEMFNGRFDILELGQAQLFSKVSALEEYMMENMATKDELRATENRLMSHIDGLYKRTDTLDQETAVNRTRSERLEGRVTRIESKIGLT